MESPYVASAGGTKEIFPGNGVGFLMLARLVDIRSVRGKCQPEVGRGRRRTGPPRQRSARLGTFTQILDSYVQDLRDCGRKSAWDVENAFARAVKDPFPDLCTVRAKGRYSRSSSTRLGMLHARRNWRTSETVIYRSVSSNASGKRSTRRTPCRGRSYDLIFSSGANAPYSAPGIVAAHDFANSTVLLSQPLVNTLLELLVCVGQRGKRRGTF